MASNIGIVKWFDHIKGFGFIERKTGEDIEDIFVQYSEILMDGFRTLSEGAEVEFDVRDTEKGPLAVNVVPLSTSND